MKKILSHKPSLTSYGTIEVIHVDALYSPSPTVTIGCWLSLKSKLGSLFKAVVTAPPESRPRFSTSFSDWTYPDSDEESDHGLLRWSVDDLDDLIRRDSNAFRMHS